MESPRRVIALDYEAFSHSNRRAWHTISAITIGLAWPLALAAWLFSLYEVETVLVSGPVVFVNGAILTLSSILVRHVWGIVLGTTTCGICILFFTLVNLLNWGPAVAAEPFAVMGIIYLFASIIPTAGAWLTRPLGKRAQRVE
jgi:hypothetical protein